LPRRFYFGNLTPPALLVSFSCVKLKKRELYALAKIAKKYNYVVIENQNFV